MDFMTGKAKVVHLKADLKDDDKREIATQLSLVLSDTMLLMITSQICHWNVTGPLFKPIRDITKEHYLDLFEAADTIAERIRALGYPAPISFAELTRRVNEDEGIQTLKTRELVEHLIEDHENFVQTLRNCAEFSRKSDDIVTHDLLVNRLKFHEKATWMLRTILAE